MKCPGQDSRYWRPGAIFDEKCSERDFLSLMSVKKRNTFMGLVAKCLKDIVQIQITARE